LGDHWGLENPFRARIHDELYLIAQNARISSMSIRSKVFQGGAYLAIRQGLGTIIGLGGILILTRVIGPKNYGLYATSVGLLTYLQTITQWGIEIYLVRQQGKEVVEVYHQAFTLLLILGSGGTVLALLGLPLLDEWIRIEGFSSIARILFLGLPITLLCRIPMARLERALNYKRVALIELGGQLAYYLVALLLAYYGFGIWALVGGWWIQQILNLWLLYKSADYHPQLYWNSSLVKQMLNYGLGFSASMWVWQLRDLVNPLIVGRFAGAEAVGYLALAIRIVQTLGFVKEATWRLSIAALGKLQGDRTRLVRTVNKGMSLQVMALGPLLVGFGLVAPWLLPRLFGPQWLPVLKVYPFIALGYLVNAVFNLHSSVLYVLQKNWAVTSFHLAHIILFIGAAFLLVPHLGLEGYGWAEIVALPSYVILHTWLLANVGVPTYTSAAIWLISFALPLFSWQLGPWTRSIVVLPLLWSRTRMELRRTVSSVLSKEAFGK
jgi:PST family polysaccharide transporter